MVVTTAGASFAHGQSFAWADRPPALVVEVLPYPLAVVPAALVV
jgi:hypothetical protein